MNSDQMLKFAAVASVKVEGLDFYDPDHGEMGEMEDLRDELVKALVKAGIPAIDSVAVSSFYVGDRNYAFHGNVVADQGGPKVEGGDIRAPNRGAWLKKAVKVVAAHEKRMAQTVKESIGSLVSHARVLLGEGKSKLVDLKPIVGDLKAKVYALPGMFPPEKGSDELSNVNVFTNYSDKRIAVMYNTQVPGTKTKDQTRAIADIVATFAKANNLTVKFEADWGEKARPRSPGEVVWTLTQ